MTAAAMLILALSGSGALALAMHKHHRDLFGTPPSDRWTISLRTAGWMAMALSLATCIAHSGPGTGVVLWLGVLTVVTLATALALAFLSSRRGQARAKGFRSRRPEQAAGT